MIQKALDDKGKRLFADGDKARFGGGTDLQIYHKSADNGNYIESQNSRRLFLEQNEIFILNEAGSEYMIHGVANGAVKLYYDNSPKLETTTNGATVTGTLTTTSGGTFGTDVTIDGSGGGTSCLISACNLGRL